MSLFPFGILQRIVISSVVSVVSVLLLEDEK